MNNYRRTHVWQHHKKNMFGHRRLVHWMLQLPGQFNGRVQNQASKLPVGNGIHMSELMPPVLANATSASIPESSQFVPIHTFGLEGRCVRHMVVCSACRRARLRVGCGLQGLFAGSKISSHCGSGTLRRTVHKHIGEWG